MTTIEKELLIQMLTNIDEVVNILTKEQRQEVQRSINKIYGCYHNLLEGVK